MMFIHLKYIFISIYFYFGTAKIKSKWFILYRKNMLDKFLVDQKDKASKKPSKRKLSAEEA